MTIPAWLREPGERARLSARLLLVVATAWAVFRTARSLGMLFHESHDLDIYYSLWFLLGHRDYAAIALSQALYLPHTWVALTPLFLAGWPAARMTMLLINGVCVFYLWWRLSRMAGLVGIRCWLLLAFFWGWLGTGLILGLGNLALVCVAAAVAAYPFASAGDSLLLALSAMKQSLVFPLYFHLLFKRPRALILPMAVFAVSGVAALLWARLSFAEGLALAKGSVDTANAWTLYDFTCMRRVLSPFIHNSLAVSVLMWITWFGLFGICSRYIKDPLAQLAALLLLSLLPMYHQKYDLVAAVPALAVCLRRCSLPWPTLMTAALATDFGASFSRLLPAGPARAAAHTAELAYYPLIILVIFGALVYLEVRRPEKGSAVERGN